MNGSFLAYDAGSDTELEVMSDLDRMESMRVLLADLRTSIEKQRRLIDVSRTLLEKT